MWQVLWLWQLQRDKLAIFSHRQWSPVSPSPATSLMWAASVLKELWLLVEESRFCLALCECWWRLQVFLLEVDVREGGEEGDSGTAEAGRREDAVGGVQTSGGEVELSAPWETRKQG